MLAIETRNLVKQYKNGVNALNSLSLKVNSGEIFSLLGPNGAGKSSLINILTTYSHATSGEVIILGKNLNQDASFIRTQVACVAQKISIDMHLSVEENMIFQAKMYKVGSDIAKKRMSELIKTFGLSDYLKRPAFSYSGGIKRRLDIAMNMMSQPKILFLDEPTVGMDIESRVAMWEMIKNIRNNFGTTVFLTTHYLEEADSLSDTICIMKEGHEIIEASPRDLRQYTGKDILQISFDNEKNALDCSNNLKQSLNIKSVEARNNFVIIGTVNSHKDLYMINNWLLEQKLDFVGIEILKPSLEDVFLNLTNSDISKGGLQ